MSDDDRGDRPRLDGFDFHRSAVNNELVTWLRKITKRREQVTRDRVVQTTAPGVPDQRSGLIKAHRTRKTQASIRETNRTDLH